MAVGLEGVEPCLDGLEPLHDVREVVACGRVRPGRLHAMEEFVVDGPGVPLDAVDTLLEVPLLPRSLERFHVPCEFVV